MGFREKGGAAPCVVTLCEHALWQLGSHRGLGSGLWVPGAAQPWGPRHQGDAPAESLHGGPSLCCATPPGTRGPPGLPAPARAAQAGRKETPAALFPQQRNPSAAGRALVLITPHPLADGVTSATGVLSSSFQKRRLPKPSHSHSAGLEATRPAPTRQF